MPEIFKAKGGASIPVVPLLDWVVRDVKPALWILLAAGGLLFAAAIGTVVNLQLAQATARRREVAIRSAIGAGAGRLARQLFVETMTLAAIGGTLGLALTALLLRVLPSLAAVRIFRESITSASTRVSSAWLPALTLAVSLAIGLLPSRMARRVTADDCARRGRLGADRSGLPRRVAHAHAGSSSPRRSPSPLSSSSAAPCSRRVSPALLAADRGYEPGNLLTARIGFFGTGLPAGSRAAFYKDVLERMTARPGVTHAGFAGSLPTASPNWKIHVGLRPGDGKNDSRRSRPFTGS